MTAQPHRKTIRPAQRSETPEPEPEYECKPRPSPSISLGAARNQAAQRLRGREQILLPLRLIAIHASHQPRGSVRRPRRDPQRPVHLPRSSIPLDVVTSQATRDQVLPAIRATTRTRQHVIDSAGGTSTVRTPRSIPAQHAAATHRNHPRTRDPHIPSEQDDRRSIPASGRPEHRILVVTGDDRRLLVHDQYECPLEGHHRQRFEARVEDQCAHFSSSNRFLPGRLPGIRCTQRIFLDRSEQTRKGTVNQ